MKFIAGIVGGLIVAILASILFTYATSNGTLGGELFFGFWLAAFVWALFAKNGGKAWRYMLVTGALLCFLLPVVAMIFTGHIASGMQGDAQTAGAVIGGGFITIVAGVAGFFLGLVLLIIGLLCGREPQVIIVQAKP